MCHWGLAGGNKGLAMGSVLGIIVCFREHHGMVITENCQYRVEDVILSPALCLLMPDATPIIKPVSPLSVKALRSTISPQLPSVSFRARRRPTYR